MANPFHTFVLLLQAIWARCLALTPCLARSPRRTPTPPELPTFTLAPPTRADTPRGQPETQPLAGSWHAEKARFIRSPSLVRPGPAASRARTAMGSDENLKTKTKTRRARPCAIGPNSQPVPNSKVGALDWTSLNYKIYVPPLSEPPAPPLFHLPFSAVPAPPVLCSSPAPPVSTPSPPPPIPEVEVATPVDNDTTSHPAQGPRISVADCPRLGDRPALSAALSRAIFAPTCYAPNPLSAVTGPLLDGPSPKVLRPILLPQNHDAKSFVDPLAKDCGATTGDGVPYPELFDFAMYARRASDRVSLLKHLGDSPLTDVSWDARYSGLSGTRAFTFGLANLELPSVWAPGLGLPTLPLRIVKHRSEC